MGNSGQRVCVLGAGIAGLVTAKVLRDDGFEVSVFEKKPNIGGVWAPSRTYPELRTNTPREMYEFSDFPYPKTGDDFPNAAQVRDYLESYVDHFDFRNLIHLSTEVVSITYDSESKKKTHPGFSVAVRPVEHLEDRESHHFDYVAVCNGVFSQPFVPEIEGMDHFDGEILHSSQFTEKESVEGKRVIVVGAGKSALDCATAASKRAEACTLVFRSPKWMTPQYFFGIRYDQLFFTRFAELFFDYHRQNRLEAWLHGPGKPLVNFYWRLNSWAVRRLIRIPDILLPEHPLPGNFNIGIGGEFYEAVHEKRAVPKRAEISAFTGGKSLEFSTGEEVEADVVIFATGWRQQLDFLDKSLLAKVKKNGSYHLYRHILPPEEPRLGFVGYAQSFMSNLTSEIPAHWLSHCFRGELSLPAKEEMDKEIARVHAWAEDRFDLGEEGFFIGPHISHYTDELMEDMGLPVHRTGNFFTEYFGRFLPRRYRGVGA